MKIEKILQGLVVAPLYLVVLLTPLFFLPFTSSPLEWNKYYLLVLCVLVSLLAWIAHGLVTKKLTVYRSPLDFPILVWWVVALLASLFSKDMVASFFGARENPGWGFVGLTVYFLLALLIMWNMRGEGRGERLLNFMGIGGALAALYFWMARFGLFRSLPFPRWNPTTELNTYFALVLVLVLTLALGFLLIPKPDTRRTLLWGIIAALSFLTIVALGFKVVWIGVAAASFLLLLFAFMRLHEVRYPVVSLTMVLFVLSIVFAVLGTPRFLTTATSTEITLAHPRSAQIAVGTMKEGVRRFLLGSGFGTFVYDFSAHRPESYNQSPAWNVRFSRPAASSYLVLAETGLLGALALLFFIVMGIGVVLRAWMKQGSTKLKGSEASSLFFAVSVLWLASVFFLFRATFSGSLWLLFFLSAALAIVFAGRAGILEEKIVTLSLKATPKFALITSFVYIVVFSATVIGGIFLGRFYVADVLAVKSARATQINRFEEAERLLDRVVKLDPYQAVYHVQAAQTLLRHAAAESRKENPNGEFIGKIIGSSINTSRRATTLAPLSVGAWEQLAELYRNTRALSKESNAWVITALGEAIKLENTNPRFYVMRGNAYLFDKKTVEAQADYEKALSLKNNYALAHYLLSVLKEGGKDIPGAIASAEAAARFAPRDLGAQYNLGRMLYNRSGEVDMARAEQIFRRILTVNRDHANTLFSLAVLLERKGELSEARSIYERVLELDPQNKTVKERLAKLPEGTPKKVEPSPIAEEEVSEEE